MKTLLKKSFLLLFFIFPLITACDKDKPMADLATRASGKYIYTEMIYHEQTIPAGMTSIRGTIIIKKKSPDYVDVTMDIRQKANDDEFMTYTIQNMVLSAGENEHIYFSDEGKRVAQLKGNKLYVNGIDDSEELFTLVATK